MIRKVALLAPDLSMGGAERVVVELARRLPRDRFEVHLVLLSARGGLLPEVPADVPLVELGVGRGRQAPVRLARRLRELRPDVVHSHLTQATLPLLAVSPTLRRGTRVVLTEHLPLSTVVRRQRSPRLWAATHRRLYRRADLVIAVSEAVARDVHATIGPGVAVTVIANPIRPTGPPGPSPFGSGRPHAVAVGRLVPQKGFDRLIEAFAAVVVKRPGARLVILGEGPERGRLAADIERLGLGDAVELVGHQPDASTWMAHADVVAATAHVEGLPLVLLEALAARTPVVAYDSAGGTREVLENVGGAVLVPDGDRDRLVDGLVAALDGLVPAPTLPDRFDPGVVIDDYARALDG